MAYVKGYSSPSYSEKPVLVTTQMLIDRGLFE